MGGMMGGGGGKGGGGQQGGTGKTTSKTQPPDWLAYYLPGLAGRANEASWNVPNTPFPGNFYAPATDAQRQSIQMGKDVAAQTQGAGNAVYDLGQKTAEGAFLDPNTNPVFQNYVNQAIWNPLYSKLADTVLPASLSPGIEAGAFGGSRDAAITNGALRTTIEAGSAPASSAAYGAYGLERQLQQQAPELIKSGIGLNTVPSDILNQVGTREQQLNQIPLNEALAQFNEKIAAPFRPLTTLTDIFSKLGSFGGGSTSQKTQGTSQSSLDLATGILGSIFGSGGATGTGGGDASSITSNGMSLIGMLGLLA